MLLPDVIFLDAAGTLFGVRGSVGNVYAQIAYEFNVKADPKSINKAFLSSFKSAPKMTFLDIVPTEIPHYEKQWWRTLAVDTFTKIEIISQFSDFEAFFSRLYDYFALADPWFVYPDVNLALDYWRSQGVELGVISNFDTRIYSVLQALSLDKFFTSVTISTEASAAKPETQIFYYAMSKHFGLASDKKAWHIGDSWAEDYQGASVAGIKGIWLNRPDSLIPNNLEVDSFIQTDRSNYAISSLTDLISP